MVNTVVVWLRILGPYWCLYVALLLLQCPVVTILTFCVNLKKLVVLLRDCIYLFYRILIMNSMYFSKQPSPFAFCNIDALCLFEVYMDFVRIVRLRGLHASDG